MTNILPLQEWLQIIKDEYLDGFVNEGGSSIKFAVPGGNGLSPLLKGRFSSMAGDLGYLVVEVDSGQTRVHMLQEIFFRIAFEQVLATNILPLQEWLQIIKDEYLDGFVNEGGSCSPAG